jgi:hypothetical protein
MDLLAAPFLTLIHYQNHLSVQEQGVQAQIASLLQAGTQEDETSNGRHTRFEELRFERNQLRSRLADVEAVIKARKQLFFEEKIITTFGALYPELQPVFSTDLAESRYCPSEHSSPEMILQAIEACYRKIETSFASQASMIIQMSLNEKHASDMADWFERVRHAFMKSKDFFSRQCGKVRYLRNQFTESFSNNATHHQFMLLKARYGAAMIEQLHAHADGKRKKAA